MKTHLKKWQVIAAVAAIMVVPWITSREITPKGVIICGITTFMLVAMYLRQPPQERR